MYERIRPSLTVHPGTTAAFKPKPLIEGYRLKILLIHIGCKMRMTFDSIFNEGAANA